MAHPAVTGRDEIIEKLTGEGLAGLEAYYPSHGPQQTEHYVNLARKLGLLPTGGSDYHGKNSGREIRLGDFSIPDELAEKLKERPRLKAFLNKSLFNGGEVNYLTVKQDGVFHVFLNKDVIDALGDNLEVCNSRAISAGQMPEQKVLLRYNGKNLGELEMRNDSEIHYREVRFNMIKPKAMEVLFEKIPMTKKFNDKVLIYGNAPRRFGRWI